MTEQNSTEKKSFIRRHRVALSITGGLLAVGGVGAALTPAPEEPTATTVAEPQPETTTPADPTPTPEETTPAPEPTTPEPVETSTPEPEVVTPAPDAVVDPVPPVDTEDQYSPYSLPANMDAAFVEGARQVNPFLYNADPVYMVRLAEDTCVELASGSTLEEINLLAGAVYPNDPEAAEAGRTVINFGAGFYCAELAGL